MASSWKSKLVGAIATGAIVAGLFPAAALGAASDLVLDSTSPKPAYSLTVGGLDNGDKATYYQIIELDTATTDAQGNARVPSGSWKLTTNVDKDQDGIVDGTENDDYGHKNSSTNAAEKGLHVEELLIKRDAEDTSAEAVDATKTDTRVLNAKKANAIASAIAKNRVTGTNPLATAVNGELTANADGKVSVPNASAGMYMFTAVPGAGNTTTIYKPIFVSADYYNSESKPEDGTHEITVMTKDGQTVTYADYSGDEGTFKRSPLEIDKKSGLWDGDTPIDMQQDVAVGDTVAFTITVPVPTFSKDYKQPQFYITDTLTEGLELVDGSVKVSVKQGSGSELATENVDYIIDEGKDITGADIEGFVVRFLNEKADDTNNDGKKWNDQDGFLYTVTGAPTCTVTYKAKVVSTAAQQVNQMDNTATLNFSNDPNYKADEQRPGEDPNTPDDPNSPGNPNKPTDEDTPELKDKTRHYTFSIDADVLGPSQDSPEPSQGGEDYTTHNRTSEVRKVWLDAAGNIIEQSEEKSNLEAPGTIDNEDKYNWLEGAEFKLVQTHKFVTTGTGTPTDANFVTSYTDPATGETVTIDPTKALQFDAKTHVLVSENGENPKSDAKGYIPMKGLDAGIYELSEIKAPLGYAFNPNIKYVITITPTYVEEPEGTTDDGKGGGGDLILDSYSISISTNKLNDDLSIKEPAYDKETGEKVEANWVTTTSTYKAGQDSNTPISFLNNSDKKDGVEDKQTSGTEGEYNENSSITLPTPAEAAMIYNKRLGMLPATGGSGIIFYLVVGGAVAGMATFLLNKTKRDDLA